MRQLALTLLVAAACTWAGSLGQARSDRAEAAGLTGPQGIRTAIDSIEVIDQVHCRPGRWHHRYRPHDECYRRYPPRHYYYYYGDPCYYPHYYHDGPATTAVRASISILGGSGWG